MTDLNVRFDEFVEKLNHMSVTEFDNMLIRCGIERIKPSVDSNYVCCLKKTFSETDKEYIVGSVFKAEVCDMYNNFELDSIGQGVA